MPPAFQWARLKADVKCALRKGAWYRILKLTSTEVVLDVRGKPPNCRDRAKLEGHPASMRCQRCNGSFEIAWNESSRVAG